MRPRGSVASVPWCGDPARAPEAGVGGPGGRPRGPRRRRHRRPPRASRRRPHPPGRGLPLPLLQQLTGAAAAVAPGGRRRCSRMPLHLPRATWTHYRVAGDAVVLDVEALPRGPRPAPSGSCETCCRPRVSRPAQLGCFGLHEWAMVHGIAGRRRAARGLAAAAGQRRAPTRWWSGTASAARTSTPTGSSPSRRDRETRCAPPATARWRWSSRGACTRGWTSTSGRSS